MEEMKHMVTQIVHHVKAATPKKFITETKPSAKDKKPADKKTSSPKEESKTDITSMSCPKCSKGKIIKGNKAYGCSDYKAGCTFLVPFEFYEKKLSDSQISSLIKTGKTSAIKGFKRAGEEIEAIVKLDKDLNLLLEPKETKESKELICPKCNKGEILVGKSAYGCGEWKAGCNFRVPLSYYGKEVSKKHLATLISGKETSVIKGFAKEGNEEKVNGKLRFGKDFVLEMVKV
jgi:DNA topoisomerase-3